MKEFGLIKWCWHERAYNNRHRFCCLMLCMKKLLVNFYWLFLKESFWSKEKLLKRKTCNWKARAELWCRKAKVEGSKQEVITFKVGKPILLFKFIFNSIFIWWLNYSRFQCTQITINYTNIGNWLIAFIELIFKVPYNP